VVLLGDQVVLEAMNLAAFNPVFPPSTQRQQALGQLSVHLEPRQLCLVASLHPVDHRLIPAIGQRKLLYALPGPAVPRRLAQDAHLIGQISTPRLVPLNFLQYGVTEECLGVVGVASIVTMAGIQLLEVAVFPMGGSQRRRL
jgi:hypothetical protein